MLSTVPVDILFQVVRHQYLNDAVSLLLTCKTLLALAYERNFWLLVLDTRRRRVPIGCPPACDLSAFSLEKLQALATASMRLESRWAASDPIPTRYSVSKHILSAREHSNIIHSIQGTDILLIHVPDKRELICWDKQLGQPFDELDHVPLTGDIGTVSEPCRAGPSEESVAFILRDAGFPHKVCQVVVTVEFDQLGKAVRLHYAISQERQTTLRSGLGCLCLGPESIGCLTIDLNHKVWLTIGQRADQSPQSLSTYDYAVQLYDYTDESPSLSCNFSYRGHFYNLLEGNTQFKVLHLSREIASAQPPRYADIPTAGYQYSLPGPPRDVASTDTEFFNLPSAPEWGICAVFIRSTRLLFSFTFVPCALADEQGSASESPLVFGAPYHVVRISGTLLDRMVWLDHSGLNLVAVVDAFGGLEMLLVRFHPGRPGVEATTSTHKVDVACLVEEIDLHKVKSIAIDDTSGTIHLLDSGGVVSTLEFI